MKFEKKRVKMIKTPESDESGGHSVRDFIKMLRFRNRLTQT